METDVTQEEGSPSAEASEEGAAAPSESGPRDAVEFVDVYKAFGSNEILKGLSLTVPEGKISVILGPSGTGKSVCINHIVGLMYPDEGDVLVHGQSVPRLHDDELAEMRKRIGLLFQDGALFGNLSVLENVCWPLKQHTDMSRDEQVEVANERLAEVGLAGAADRSPSELSGGMRKRAGFARALVMEPDIVLFDEPDSGLDPVRTALLSELIREVHADMSQQATEKEAEYQPTFCVITHNIGLADRIAEYVTLLYQGGAILAGDAEDVRASDDPFVKQFLAGEADGPLDMG